MAVLKARSKLSVPLWVVLVCSEANSAKGLSRLILLFFSFLFFLTRSVIRNSSNKANV